jgi:hypothetical protein
MCSGDVASVIVRVNVIVCTDCLVIICCGGCHRCGRTFRKIVVSGVHAFTPVHSFGGDHCAV